MDLPSILAAVGVPAPYCAVILAIVGLASVLAAALPVPASATSFYGRLWSFLNFLAANFGNAKNAKTPPTA